MTSSIWMAPGERTTPDFIKRFTEVVNADENPVKILAIDPGKKNGICGYDVKYHPMFMMTVMSDDMTVFMDCFDRVEKCIIEDFKLYPSKTAAQIYSDMETSRIIGRIESWAIKNEVELIKQGASIKKTGYAWQGVRPPSKSNPLNHQMDAHTHFVYWAVRLGKIDARSLL